MWTCRGAGALALVLVVGIAAMLLPAVAEAQDRRVALVIGNAAYRHAPALANPVNDAADTATALRRIGFEVIERQDLDLRGMRVALREFSDQARGAELALLFFAGHGLQVARQDRAENFLVPVDARLADARDVEDETVPLTRVLDWLDGAQARIVILDACRDNPLTRRMSGGTRAVGRGLAPLEGATHGTLVVYSTEPGATAADGAARNSPFTAALVEHLPAPGVEVRHMLTRVRQRVVETTQGRQTPWSNDGLLREVFLASAPPAPAPPAMPAPIVAVPQVSEDVLDLTFWQSVKDSDRVADFEAYLTQFPTGRFAALARNRIAVLRPSAEPRGVAVPAVPRPLDSAGIRAAQRLLTAMGLPTGGADGVAGPRSREALRAFALAADLGADAGFTSDMLERLRDPAPPAPRRADALRQLAEEALHGGRAADAVRLARAARALEPASAGTQLLLGRAELVGGNVDAARLAYQEAARLGSGTAAGEEARRRLAALPAPTPPRRLRSDAVALAWTLGPPYGWITRTGPTIQDARAAALRDCNARFGTCTLSPSYIPEDQAQCLVIRESQYHGYFSQSFVKGTMTTAQAAAGCWAASSGPCTVVYDHCSDPR